MGYYTYYRIEEVTGDNAESLKQDFNAGVIQTTYGPLNEMFSGAPGVAFDTMKWYDHSQDMKAISARYPNTLIVLRGEGEESGDLWRAYYRNGEEEFAQAQITFPAPSLLILNNAVAVIEDEEDLPDEDI